MEKEQIEYILKQLQTLQEGGEVGGRGTGDGGQGERLRVVAGDKLKEADQIDRF